MKEAVNYRDLPPEEKEKLWRGIKVKDETALGKLLLLNEGLVCAVVSRFVGPEDREDLLQSGRLGLLKAAEGFDPRRGVPFGIYAFPFIKGEVLHAAALMRGQKKAAFCRGEKVRRLSLEEITEFSELALKEDNAENLLWQKLEDRLTINSLIGKLAEDERRLLYMRYVRRLSQSETGAKMNLSQTRISRKEKEILAKMRGWL